MSAGPASDGSADDVGSGAGTADRPSVLVVYSVRNLAKIERHVGPLTEAADVTMVCIDADESVDGVDYVTVPDFGVRPVGLVLMALAAFVEAWRGDYDAVASFSLLPNGCIALAVGALFGLPTHLGIIGIDLDVHVEARYGAVVRALIRRFDAVSVPGTAFRDRLLELGVAEDRATILVNPIDVGTYHPVERDPEFDLLWVGRFESEKDPLTFLAALDELADRGRSFNAVLAGDGPLHPVVERAVRERALADRVDLVGWVDDPADYYRRAGAFVLTSERDALPLSLVEAMATGLPSVVPAVGNVPDVARDGETALVADDRTPAAFADALDRLLGDDDLRERLGANAGNVSERYSYDAATDDWCDVLVTMDVVER
ncbi:glycosyltransferase [Halomarina litorea]|uniref:glycosyltransferase n=1 Tax=Halomarina litorea TaxID=2961595 RepID=UPI0020C2C87C|nr:glycosyltransferase [Halomarina sp. BCD28]